MRFFRLRPAIIAVFSLGIAIAGFAVGARYREMKYEVKGCHSDDRFAWLKYMLLNYHRKHGAFPPTKYKESLNGPVHSWRVLLVRDADPELKERFARYDFSQTWDSVDNMRALQGISFSDYFCIGSGSRIANYVAIGEGDQWPANAPLASYLVSAGKDRFLLVEWPASDVNWMEPRY